MPTTPPTATPTATPTTLSIVRRPRALLSAVAVLGLVVAVVAVGPTTADGAPEPIRAEPLTQRHAFTDDVAVQVRDRPDGRSTDVVNLRDATHVAVAEITIQPGAQFPWHTHPGPVLATVVSGDPDGAFVYTYGDDCVERPYEVGEAFVDPGDSVHTAVNPSSTHETVVVATFLGVPADGALTVPVAPEEAAERNEACGTDAPIPDAE